MHAHQNTFLPSELRLTNLSQRTKSLGGTLRWIGERPIQSKGLGLIVLLKELGHGAVLPRTIIDLAMSVHDSKMGMRQKLKLWRKNPIKAIKRCLVYRSVHRRNRRSEPDEDCILSDNNGLGTNLCRNGGAARKLAGLGWPKIGSKPKRPKRFILAKHQRSGQPLE